jgi:hypothetical protein
MFSLFLTDAGEFSEWIARLLSAFDAQKKEIEAYKLRAIGLRNQIEGKRQKTAGEKLEFEAEISEKKKLLERYVVVVVVVVLN